MGEAGPHGSELCSGLALWTRGCCLPRALAGVMVSSRAPSEGQGREEAAAGSRQELRLGVGRGLLCWELSSGSHQQGGREGAAFPGPHTPAGPAGTQPASPQPPSPTWGSPRPGLARGSVSEPSGTRGLQQGRCLANTSPKTLDTGLEKPTHLLW